LVLNNSYGTVESGVEAIDENVILAGDYIILAYGLAACLILLMAGSSIILIL
jgi:hypothetical protein